MRLTLTPADYRALAEFRFQVRKFFHFSEVAAREGLGKVFRHPSTVLSDPFDQPDRVGHGSWEDDLGSPFDARARRVRHRGGVGLPGRLG